VDDTIKAILEKLRHLEGEKETIERDISHIESTLKLLGIESPHDHGHSHEDQYATTHPFGGMALKDACLKILADAPGAWFSKSQVEYLLTRGGYRSEAKDPGNSVDITLRSLVEFGLCEVIRHRGVVGNRYSVKRS